MLINFYHFAKVYNFYKLHGLSRLLILLLNKIKKFFFLKQIIFKILKVTTLNSKVVFIDIGANKGDAFLFFNRSFSERQFDYILIEPNNFLKKKLKKLTKNQQNVSIINEAAHIKDGNALFYNFSNKNSNQLESGMVKINQDWDLSPKDKKKVIKIKVFNFSKFLKKLKRKYKLIIVKMDIEGSEYKILNHLFFTKTINLINFLFIEFHSVYINNKAIYKLYKLKEDILKKKLKKSSVITCIW